MSWPNDFDKGAMTNREKVDSSITGPGTTGQSQAKEGSWISSFTSCTKINSKWINDLHIGAKTIELRVNLHLDLGSVRFLEMMLKT